MKIYPARGFIVLTSTMIMSTVLLIMMFTIGVIVFLSRLSVLDTEQKQGSVMLAEACVQTAFLNIAQNTSYAPASGGECVSVSDSCEESYPVYVCKICSVTENSGEYTVRTRAALGGAYTNLEVQGTLVSNNYAIVSWREVGTYSGAICTIP
jgi:Tfp pilus assembly protein PilX